MAKSGYFIFNDGSKVFPGINAHCDKYFYMILLLDPCIDLDKFTPLTVKHDIILHDQEAETLEQELFDDIRVQACLKFKLLISPNFTTFNDLLNKWAPLYKTKFKLHCLVAYPDITLDSAKITIIGDMGKVMVKLNPRLSLNILINFNDYTPIKNKYKLYKEGYIAYPCLKLCDNSYKVNPINCTPIINHKHKELIVYLYHAIKITFKIAFGDYYFNFYNIDKVDNLAELLDFVDNNGCCVRLCKVRYNNKTDKYTDNTLQIMDVIDYSNLLKYIHP